MAENKRPQSKRRYNGPAREIKCSCGGAARMKTKKSFPFGNKSGGRSITFYKCQSCGKRSN